MQVVDSPFSSSLPHYHSYYQFQSPGTHDHELKRQYLSLLPPKQIIEICLTFDVYVPPYAKTAVWPLDLNAAIAGLQRNASSSLSETAKNALVNTKPPEAQEACTSERESAKTGEPPPTDNQAASERSTAPQLSPSEVLNPQKPSNTESQETQIASAPTAQSQHAPSVPNPVYPQTPFGYGHVQVAYPHAPYYASGYPYPYPYPPQVPNGQTSPPAPTLFPPHPGSYSSVFPPHQPEASGNDDLPSYEEMIVEALSECTDPDGWVPKDLFSWMAARYPLQSNFRPSASQALQKAYKRGRFEKGTNGKYRLSASWEGGSTSRRTTRRPQTQNHASSSSANRTSAPPFTHAPLVHHHHPPHGHTPGQPPYPMPPYGYPGYPGYTHQPPASNFNAPGTGPSTSNEGANTSTTAGDSAVAYEAAQSILKAINFGGLLKLPQDEHESKDEDSCQPPHTVDNGVEHLLSHVQAILASRSSEEAATSGSLPGMVAETAPSVPPSLPVQVPENKRAELQAQLALLSAQLAELAQMEESRVESGQTSIVASRPVPPMHSLTPDESGSLPQPLKNTSSPTLDHTSTDGSGVFAASAEEGEPESDEDDMEEVI